MTSSGKVVNLELIIRDAKRTLYIRHQLREVEKQVVSFLQLLDKPKQWLKLQPLQYKELRFQNPVSGVYGVGIEKELVYIGQSCNIIMRLDSHRRNQYGTHAFWIASPESQRFVLEATLIDLLEPIKSRSHRSARHGSTYQRMQETL